MEVWQVGKSQAELSASVQGTNLAFYQSGGKPSGALIANSAAPAQLTPLAQFAYSKGISEFSFNGAETTMAFRKDGSLAARISSKLDVKLKVEQVSIDLNFSAEFLGLTAKDFEATGGQPMQLTYKTSFSNLTLHQKVQQNMVKTTRTLEEIIGDIAKMLHKAFSQPGDKKISLMLDEEAISALLSGDKMSALYMQIMWAIQTLNSLKASEKADQYVIKISGKGQPYLNREEETEVNGEMKNVDIHITINPPQASLAESTVAAAADPPAPAEETAV